MSIGKKGELTDSIIGVVVCVAVVASLLFLSFSLMSSGYDSTKEISKSYIERLKMEFNSLDSGGVSEFIILNNGNENLKFYLVYFGGVLNFKLGDKILSSSLVGDNVLCICSEEDSILCNNCFNSKFPVSFNGNKSEKQVLGEDIRFEIFRRGDYYEFFSK